MPSTAGLLLLLLCASCALAESSWQASEPPEDLAPSALAGLRWRTLLQANGGGGENEVAVILNANTKGQPVYCINATKPFVERLHGASGREAPTGADVDALAARICSDPQAAGREIFTKIEAGGWEAKKAAAAVKRANCGDPKRVPDALTTATIRAQDSQGSLEAIQGFFQRLVDAFKAVGLPACVTLIESNPSGEIINERYIQTA